jgi:hypothetical protein
VAFKDYANPCAILKRLRSHKTPKSERHRLTVNLIKANTPIQLLVLMMPQNVVANLIFLLARTPVALSQAALAVMFVVLGFALMVFGFGRLSKTQVSLLQHRWLLTIAVTLTLGVIFLVMTPSAFRFYIDPNLQVLSGLSITTLIHAAIGLPAWLQG